LVQVIFDVDDVISGLGQKSKDVGCVTLLPQIREAQQTAAA